MTDPNGPQEPGKTYDYRLQNGEIVSYYWTRVKGWMTKGTKRTPPTRMYRKNDGADAGKTEEYIKAYRAASAANELMDIVNNLGIDDFDEKGRFELDSEGAMDGLAEDIREREVEEEKAMQARKAAGVAGLIAFYNGLKEQAEEARTTTPAARYIPYGVIVHLNDFDEFGTHRAIDDFTSAQRRPPNYPETLDVIAETFRDATRGMTDGDSLEVMTAALEGLKDVDLEGVDRTEFTRRIQLALLERKPRAPEPEEVDPGSESEDDDFIVPVIPTEKQGAYDKMRKEVAEASKSATSPDLTVAQPAMLTVLKFISPTREWEWMRIANTAVVIDEIAKAEGRDGVLGRVNPGPRVLPGGMPREAYKAALKVYADGITRVPALERMRNIDEFKRWLATDSLAIPDVVAWQAIVRMRYTRLWSDNPDVFGNWTVFSGYKKGLVDEFRVLVNSGITPEDVSSSTFQRLWNAVKSGANYALDAGAGLVGVVNDFTKDRPKPVPRPSPLALPLPPARSGSASGGEAGVYTRTRSRTAGLVAIERGEKVVEEDNAHGFRASVPLLTVPYFPGEEKPAYFVNYSGYFVGDTPKRAEKERQAHRDRPAGMHVVYSSSPPPTDAIEVGDGGDGWGSNA